MVKIVNELGDIKTGRQGEAVYQRRYGQQIRRTLKPKRAIPSEKQLEHRQLYRLALSWRKSLSLANRRFLDGYCISSWIIDSYGIPLPWSRFALKLYLEHAHFVPDLTTKSSAPSSEMGEYYNTGDDTYTEFYGDVWRGQTFTPSKAQTITSVKLKMYRANWPGTITVAITAVDGEHKPTGPDLCVGTTDGDTLTSSVPGEWREITLGDGASLAASTEYAIVIKALDGNATNKVRMRMDQSSPAYEEGLFVYSNNGGDTWATSESYDAMFETYIEIPGEEYTAGTVTVRHPALKKVILNRDGAPVNQWDNLSSLDDELLTKHLVVDVVADDVIEVTTVTGRQFTYRVR